MTQKISAVKILTYAAVAAALFIALLMSAQSASAFPNFMTGHSGNPAINGGATCSDCHMGGARPSVVIIGPTSVEPGETANYTLRISGGPAQLGGLNVSATDGIFASLG